MSEIARGALQQGKSGKLVARARIMELLDDHSFVELDRYLQKSNAVLGYADVCIPGEGVITGWGTIDGQAVCVAAQDCEALNGAFGLAHAQKIVKVMNMAAKSGYPMIFLWDSNGARVQEGAAAIHAYTIVMKKMAELSGVVPIISVAAGGMLGSAAFFAPLSDFTIMIKKITDTGLKGTTVTAATLSLNPDAEVINGAEKQYACGNAQFLCEDEKEAYTILKRLMLCLPSNNLEDAPYLQNEDAMDRTVESETKDVPAYVACAADGGIFFEIQKGYGDEIAIGFSSFGGKIVGIVANRGGKPLTNSACEKASRFIQFLDAYDMPIISFVDNEGVEVSSDHRNIRALAKLIYAYGEAGCPMISVIVGKAIGEGYSVMSNKGNGADLVYALKTAKIGCMDEKAGSIVMYDGSISQSSQYASEFLSAESAAKQGIVDDIIAPEEIRTVLIKALSMVSDKREGKLSKKHGIMPL